MKAYYGRVFTANDRQWKPKAAKNLTISAENVHPRPATPTLQGLNTAPAEPILLKC